MPAPTQIRTALVIGASRGLGKAIAESYAARGAHVVATVRQQGPSPLHELAAVAAGSIEIEQLDIDDPAQVTALRRRLEGRSFDILFVVAGISLAPRAAIGAEIDTLDFQRMMLTNVLGVMRTVESLDELVDPCGTIAVMSSGQGSIANNANGGFEVYRATKAALNQMFRSYAARHAGEQRSLLLLAPGWVRTDMGGPDAGLEIADSIPPLLDTVDSQRGVAGLQFLDRHGRTVNW